MHGMFLQTLGAFLGIRNLYWGIIIIVVIVILAVIYSTRRNT
jgi:hypothetical protein